MNPLFNPVQLPADLQAYWTPTMFSNELVKMHNAAIQYGLTLHMSYPDKNASQNTLNIAEIPYQGMQLGEYIVNQYAADTNTKFQNKKSNWVLLVHMLLEQTVCYLESPSEKFRQKIIATRNLALANILCGSPIKNFDIFYAILSLNFAGINALKAQNPNDASVFDIILNIMNTLQTNGFTLTNQLLDWFTSTFNASANDIKTFFSAYRLFQAKNVNDECVENKCSYIKLTADDKGNLSLPKRFTGTKYAVTMDTILVPLHFMRAQAAWVLQQLATGVIAVQFKRDNDVVRDMLASSNSDILSAVFKENTPTLPASYVESRGYIRCVDICCSSIGEDVYRAISLARVLSMKVLHPDITKLDSELSEYGFSSSFASVDLNAVIPAFKSYVAQINTNLVFLTMVYKGINPSAGEASFTSPYQVEFAINQYVDLQSALTSSFARKLHLYMLNNPMLFPGYSGAPEDLSSVKITTAPKFQALGLE